MTRILTLTSWYPPHHVGGYELSCFDVMLRLVDRGHDLRILCSEERLHGAAMPEPGHEKLVFRELRPHLLEASSRRPPLRERRAMERHNHRALERHLADHRPDVVSVWHMRAISISLLRSLEERRIPVVYVVCDDWPVYAEELDAWTSLFLGGAIRSLAGRVIEMGTRLPTTAGDVGESGAFCFVSESTRRHALAQKPWSYPLSTVVYSGINRDEFPNREVDSGGSWRWRLAYVGRLDPFKGIETLLRALTLLPAEATLKCYGRGGKAERERLIMLAGELGVADRVTFASLERHELPNRYEAADVLVFPSEWEEPFGLVPIEAMACGTPVVATGVGGSGEFLRDGYNCVLFPPTDANALAAAVRRLYTDPDLRRGIVFGGYRTANELDVERLTDVLEQWHLAAAERFARGRPADRILDLPDASGDDHPVEVHGLPPDAGRIVARALDRAYGLVLVAPLALYEVVHPKVARHDSKTVVAVDADEHTVRIAKQHDERVIRVVARADHLPFRTAAFDAIATQGVLERLANDGHGVREFARVAKSGGVAVLVAANRGDALKGRARIHDRLRRLKRPARAYFHSTSQLREYSVAEFERLVTPVFQIQARHAVGWDRGWKSRIVTALVRFRPLQQFSQTIVLEARPSPTRSSTMVGR